MSIIGSLIKRGLTLRKKAVLRKPSAFAKQKQTLKKLLTKASNTEFGKHYQFQQILKKFVAGTGQNDLQFYEAYKKTVPIFDYNKIYAAWWHRTLKGETDICWPGEIKYFALSSGTSEASTKHLPVTKDLLKAMQGAGMQQLLSLTDFNLPDNVFTTGILMLGGSTDLNNHGHYYEGDMSGIQTAQLPSWFRRFYKPGKKIAYETNWEKKLQEITLRAKDWNIGIVTGVPAWVQMLFERIIAHYGVKNIHEIWPNFSLYVHGGISFDPYKKSFEKLLGRPIVYLETYIASEGWIASQANPKENMSLHLNKGLFMEFVPFTDNNFGPDGEIIATPEALMVHQVEEGQDYAILLSTCAGAWRYLIGDVIRFTNKERCEIIITGRTKHFISLCGEHLSVDNMNSALLKMNKEKDLNITEFTVAGIPSGTLFGHHWFYETDETTVSAEAITQRIDELLMELNDDYKVERGGPLKEVIGTKLPVGTFYKFMVYMGKAGGQNKFPRVLKGKQLEKWMTFLKEENLL